MFNGIIIMLTEL